MCRPKARALTVGGFHYNFVTMGRIIALQKLFVLRSLARYCSFALAEFGMGVAASCRARIGSWVRSMIRVLTRKQLRSAIIRLYAIADGAAVLPPTTLAAHGHCNRSESVAGICIIIQKAIRTHILSISSLLSLPLSDPPQRPFDSPRSINCHRAYRAAPVFARHVRAIYHTNYYIKTEVLHETLFHIFFGVGDFANARLQLPRPRERGRSAMRLVIGFVTEPAY
jgi:hypothetical protein